MTLTFRETLTAIHGMIFGFGLIVFFIGTLVLLLTLQSGLLTAAGVRVYAIILKICGLLTAVLGWLTVIVGTYIVYPWYRAPPPAGATELAAYPRSRLLASEALSGWHSFGMEWKEHLGWLVPIMATVAAFIIFRYGPRLIEHRRIVWTLLVILVVAFAAAGAVGLLGAFITKAAPLV